VTCIANEGQGASQVTAALFWKLCHVEALNGSIRRPLHISKFLHQNRSVEKIGLF
jgi:hypothetical protein